MTVRIKRVYEPAEEADGFRVLVDRLWPRGETKEKARVALWLKEVAPSTELRRWFHHEERLFDEFAARYRAELDANGELVEQRLLVVEPAPQLRGRRDLLEPQVHACLLLGLPARPQPVDEHAEPVTLLDRRVHPLDPYRHGAMTPRGAAHRIRRGTWAWTSSPGGAPCRT